MDNIMVNKDSSFELTSLTLSLMALYCGVTPICTAMLNSRVVLDIEKI
jgi:hypothetical protein